MQSHFYPPILSQTILFNYCYAVSYILTVDARVSSKRIIPTNQIAWRHNPDDSNVDAASGIWTFWCKVITAYTSTFSITRLCTLSTQGIYVSHVIITQTPTVSLYETPTVILNANTMCSPWSRNCVYEKVINISLRGLNIPHPYRFPKAFSRQNSVYTSYLP